MRLLYDLLSTQSAKGDHYHGGSEYAKIVFRKLAEENAVNLSALYNPDQRFDPEFADFIEHQSVELVGAKSEKEVRQVLETGAHSRFYSPLPKLWNLGNLSTVEYTFTLHGLRALEMPTDRYEAHFLSGVDRLRSHVKRCFKRRYVEQRHKELGSLLSTNSKKTTIVTDSNHSKFALLNFYPSLDVDAVQVFYAPPTSLQLNTVREEVTERVSHQYNVRSRGFFLLVSGGVWRKNAYRAVLALDELYSRHRIVQDTVILGCPRSDIFQIRNKSRFQFLPYVSEEELGAFYRLAFCFIYPSLNEGFGYPPLESMAAGTPVICSSATSLPEVCGSSVLYFNPYSITELKNRILQLSCDMTLWEEYTLAGRQHATRMVEKQSRGLADLCALLASQYKEQIEYKPSNYASE